MLSSIKTNIKPDIRELAGPVASNEILPELPEEGFQNVTAKLVIVAHASPMICLRSALCGDQRGQRRALRGLASARTTLKASGTA